MNLKQYQNEIIVIIAFILMLGTFSYKHYYVSAQVKEAEKTALTLSELKEVVGLKKIWGNKNITKKVTALEKMIVASKVKWNKKGKKVTATYTGLSDSELNKLTTKMLNIPIEITLLDIQKNESLYNVEFKCKW
ncbi:MAG: Unknown protein [uncultured Sulfurovum sp.]|uniref:Type II secretion system protein M n=1 Tax=uncultured Sulfurovum sp. TaxID=269237 RepID=A0A6S6U032_9BACT|nr:MAG: Unknown protein [uncultured Sulfurovum sp.]